MLPIDRSVVNHELHGLCFPSMTRKNPAAVALGRMTSAKKAAAARKNAKRAVAARMRNQTEEERTAQAKKAAAARWGKKH